MSLTLSPRLVLTAALLVLVGAAIAWLLRRRRPRLPRGRLALGLTAAVGALAVATLGFVGQQQFNQQRYLRGDPVIAALQRLPAPGAHVGVVGRVSGAVSPVYPAFGPRLARAVSYVGYFEDGFLKSYVAREPFQDALARGGYDYLVVRQRSILDPSDPVSRPLQDALPRDAELQLTAMPWAEWAEDAGWAPVSTGEALVLLKAPEATATQR